MGTLEDFIASIGTTVWVWCVLPLVAILGLYFTIRTGVLQVRLLPRMFSGLTDRTPTDARGKPQSLSAFQAFTVSAASRVGIGNIAGVGTAIAVGGPGAIFWMWAMAFIGGALSFAEATLGQLYKHRDSQGFRGGPAYYIERGLKARWLGIIFAVLLIIAAPFATTSLQAFTITETITGATGNDSPAVVAAIGIVLALLVGAVVLGGIRRIGVVTEVLVPAMAVLYLVLGIAIVWVNADQLGPALGAIVEDAFGAREVAGGAIGTVILVGVQRGMFSNEAGLGTAPHAAASAATTHPVKQGLVQTLGVYFDTFIVCSITAFIILTSVPDLANAEKGISLTQTAVTDTLGDWAGHALAVIVFLLAFSTILGLYFYGEANIEYMTERPGALVAYRALAIVAVLAGATASASVVWTLADTFLGMLAVVNLAAVALLSKHVLALLRNYSRQSREGRDPVFVRDQLPDAQGIEAWESHESVTGLGMDEPPANDDEGALPH